VVYKETGGTRNGVPGFFTDENIENFDWSGCGLFAGVSFSPG
jgi:hypothetical protein